MKYCIKCVIPETQDAITFDSQGVCYVCRNNEYKYEKVDWAAKEKEFLQLVEQFRGKGQYDCIIPFSGGKDSTFQVYALVKKYKLKPLVVNFDYWFYRSRHKENVERTLNRLGVDFLLFRPNWKVVKAVMLEAFKRKGDFCWPSHTGIYAYPMQIAVKFKIPLIIWGESVAEYMSFFNFEEHEEVDEKRFHRCVNLGITAEDMVGMLADSEITMRDLEPFAYPPLKELKAIGYRSICLGNYIKWDPRGNSEIIARELGWKGNTIEGVPPGYEYEKTEYILQGIRDYVKYIKRGFGRTAHLASMDIRSGRITRERALELVKKYDGKRPSSLDIFLKIFGLTEEEFNRIAASHAVAPYVHDFSKTERAEKLPDHDEWMNKDYYF